jgi:hypothetical protein
MIRTPLMIRHALRVSLLGGAALLSLASGHAEGGDRANGGCPEGETCSPDTPDGLYFTGSPLGDAYPPVTGKPQRIALGGRETISVFRDEDATSEFLGFAAAAGSQGITVGDVAGNSVVVTGVASGSDYLRIVDPRNDELFDRVMLTIAPIDHVALLPPRLDLLGDRALFDDTLPAVVYKASTLSNRFVIALFDEADVRLVDESLSVQQVGGFATMASAWDGLRQTQALAPGTYTIDVGFGDGSTAALEVTLVDRADAVTWVEGQDLGARTAPGDGLGLGAVGHYCFRATNAGRPVLGESFAFSASGVLGVTPEGQGCVRVEPTSPGLGTLFVDVGDVGVSYDITVAASKRGALVRASEDDGPLEGTPLPAVTAAQPGERAASQAP